MLPRGVGLTRDLSSRDTCAEDQVSGGTGRYYGETGESFDGKRRIVDGVATIQKVSQWWTE